MRVEILTHILSLDVHAITRRSIRTHELEAKNWHEHDDTHVT